MLLDLFGLFASTIVLAGVIAHHVFSVLNSSAPVSADARQLRAALRDAPREGRVRDLPLGRGLTEPMRREIADSEGFSFYSTRKLKYFEYTGRSREELPDA